MAGTQTNNFDLVIELAEQALAEWMSSLLDSAPSGGSGNIFEVLFGDGAFSLTLALDRPPGIPTSARDVLAVSISVGSVASLAFAVEVKVERRNGPEVDALIIDFENGVHGLELDLPGGFFGGIAADLLEEQFADFLAGLGTVSFFELPVTRNTTDPEQPAALDLRLIDDTGPEDRDALALLLSFGGASGQNAAGFTQGIIDSPNTGAVLVFFGWICRLLAPRLEEELGLQPGSMIVSPERCEFNGDKVLDEEEQVSLKLLSIRLVDGAVKVEAEITKSGFCYEAKGKVSASLRLEVADGQLSEDLVVDDPDVEVEVPWYCWLGAIALGAIAGGVVGFLVGGVIGGLGGAAAGGIIGAIVGGILFPLILWALTEAVEHVVEAVGEAVADAINAADPEVTVPLPGLSIVFQDVTIDDITLDASFRATENAPVRCQGEAVLGLGQSIDLDTGGLDAPQGTSDVVFRHGLVALCNSRIGRLTADFTSVSRFTLYPVAYQRGATIPQAEFLILDQTHIPPRWAARARTYAYTTTQGRYGVLEIVDAAPDSVRLRYRTYGETLPGARIVGDFSTKRRGWDLIASRKETLASLPLATFSPTPWRATLAHLQPPSATGPTSIARPVKARPEAWTRRTSPSVGSGRRPPLAADRRPEEGLLDRARIGRWHIRQTSVVKGGRFVLQSVGLDPQPAIRWSVNGTVLSEAAGSLEVAGATLTWEAAGSHLTLSSRHHRAFTFSLEAVALGTSTNEIARASRCLTWTPEIVRDKPIVVDLATFRAQLGQLMNRG